MKEEFEDTKGVIRICQSKKYRKHNGQRKKDKQRFITHTHKTKDQVTGTPRKTGVNSGAPKDRQFLHH
jgi:transposase-like protein